MRSLFALVLATALATPCALAQNFNIDVGEDPGTGFPAPSTTYPGAASQPGEWNRLWDGSPGVPPTSQPWYTTDVLGATTLFDIGNAPTPVTHSVQVLPAGNNSLGDFIFNNAGTTGDDQNLYDDLEDIGNAAIAGSMHIWTFSNLANGTYDVYTYAWAPDNATFTTRVSAANSTSTTQTSGGAWPGTHGLGVTYTLHTVSVTTGTMTITVESLSGFGSVNGFQMKMGISGPGTAFCSPGAGGVQSCVCGNPNGAGVGCSNTGSSGASLASAGVASLASDATDPGTVTVTGTNMLSGSSCIFLQGDGLLAAGTPFGAGIRCAGGQLLRLYVKSLVGLGGTKTAPEAADRSISNRCTDLLSPISSGQTRYYQTYYRDPNLVNPGGGCPAIATFNVTSAQQIIWGP